MLGAIAGDIIGSIYEGHPIKTTKFPLFAPDATFTDDTVLTVAVADAILHQRDYRRCLRTYGRRYPEAGYGSAFRQWLYTPGGKPYNSWGNGSAMRVSPVGFAFASIEDVLSQARRCAEITHNHPEGIKGAQATAIAVFLARKGETKHSIRQAIGRRFGYDLQRRLDDIRPDYTFDISCQGSVPESIIAFLESDDVETAVRNAVSLGGDADTMACIAGAIAQAYYKTIPAYIIAEVRSRLPEDFLSVIDEFNRTYDL